MPFILVRNARMERSGFINHQSGWDCCCWKFKLTVRMLSLELVRGERENKVDIKYNQSLSLFPLLSLTQPDSRIYIEMRARLLFIHSSAF